MGQEHKRFREFRTPFPLRDIRENPRSNVRACAAGDGAICSKNRKIVPYHGANPNTRNGARLRSPSLIMAPGEIQYVTCRLATQMKSLSKLLVFFNFYFTWRVTYPGFHVNWCFASQIDYSTIRLQEQTQPCRSRFTALRKIQMNIKQDYQWRQIWFYHTDVRSSICKGSSDGEHQRRI